MLFAAKTGYVKPRNPSCLAASWLLLGKTFGEMGGLGKVVSLVLQKPYVRSKCYSSVD